MTTMLYLSCKVMSKARARTRRARFYIDECVPDWVMVHLWARGFNAHLSKDDLGPTTDDTLLLRQARRQGRVFVTIDKGKNIKRAIRGVRHPGVIVISGDKPNETLVCSALDTLLQWGAKRKEDYENLYIKISKQQLTIEMEDGDVLAIGSDGSLTLHQANGTVCQDPKTINQHLKALG